MKIFFTLFCSLAVLTFSTAQNPVLELDGEDDYINLGIEVGNGVRTIEMWFNPQETIDSGLDVFSTLAAREISATNGNMDEFSLSFQPSSLPNPGALRFDIDGQQPVKAVYSNSNTWNADQWYHVAAVVHPTEGMMLFIDGIKQTSTHINTETVGTSSNITAIGTWGDLNARFFNGKIDNVRFSSEGLYLTDFQPLCGDLETQTNDTGLWDFNENQGTVAIDSSPIANNGQLVGATRIYIDLCSELNPVNTNDLVNSIPLKIFPNPSSGIFNFNYEQPNNSDLQIIIYNSIGQVVLTQKVIDVSFEINLQDRINGIYFYQLKKENIILNAGTLEKVN